MRVRHLERSDELRPIETLFAHSMHALPGIAKGISAHLFLYDPQTQIRRIPPLFPEEESGNGQAPQPRHLFNAGQGKAARAGRAVLQAPLTVRSIGCRDVA